MARPAPPRDRNRARLAKFVVGAVALAVLVGCGGHGPSATAAHAGRITVRQRQSTCCYTEGQVSYVRLSRATGLIRARSFHGHGVGVDVVALDEVVARGTYRVESWQRPCDGNCDHLDAPTDRCSATVAVEAAQHRRVSITFSAGSGCTIVVG